MGKLYDLDKISEHQYENLKKTAQKIISLSKEKAKLSRVKLNNEKDNLNENLEALLSADDFNNISNDLDVMEFLIANQPDKSQHGEKRVKEKLKSLHDAGKLNDNEYEDLKESVIKNIELMKENGQSIEDKIKVENSKLDQKLNEILSNDDYSSLSDEMALMEQLIASNSENIEQQENKLYENLQDLHSSGKLTDEEHDTLKKSVQKSVSLLKKQ